MPLPLHGIKVLDLSRALAGPYCTALLADMGAEVIKVETITGGDTSRKWPPFEGTNSLYFDSINRNKRSISVDLYSDSGRHILDCLVRECDVLVENFRPGTLDKMGLTSAALKSLNPDLIVSSISGFGAVGPLKDMPGLDQVVQGMSGLTSVTGPDPRHTYRTGVSIIDITTGMISAFSVVSGLLGRARGGPGSRMSTSLLETGLALSVFQGQKALSLGVDPEPQGNDHPTITPYGVFSTETAPITLAVATDRSWHAFCELIEAVELSSDERFATSQGRLAHRDELKARIEAHLSKKDAETWVDQIRAIGIPCGPIYTYSEAFDTEQVRALEMIQSTTRHDGSHLPVLRGPLNVDGKATAVRTAPPELGQHSEQILAEIGFDQDTILRLKDAGTIHVPSPDDAPR